MFRKFFQLFFTFFIIVSAMLLANAQTDATTRNGSPDKEALPKGIYESLAKQRIEREKKDHSDLLKRGEEAAKLSDELEKSFVQNSQLSAEDRKKLDRLEKVFKKILTELGGEDNEKNVESGDKPLSVVNALKSLQNNTIKLLGELKKTTRHSVSVMAVESSSLLLKVVRILRFGNNQNK